MDANNATGFTVETIKRLLDLETGTAVELFESIPKAGIDKQDHPYGVRLMDTDANEVVGITRYMTLGGAAAGYHKLIADSYGPTTDHMPGS